MVQWPNSRKNILYTQQFAYENVLANNIPLQTMHPNLKRRLYELGSERYGLAISAPKAN